MTVSKKKKTPNRRHMARIYAMQALYQWHFTLETPEMLVEDFLFDSGMSESNTDIHYFQMLLSGTIDHASALDTLLTPLLDRSIKRLNPVELAVLRLGAYELAYQKSVPYAVVLNEAIELTKTYGACDGHKYVNGVLNALLSSLRKEEIK